MGHVIRGGIGRPQGEMWPTDAFPDSFDLMIALLERDGIMLSVNDAWERFGARNGDKTLVRGAAGHNYVQICRSAGEWPANDVRLILSGIQSVLDGHQDSFHHEFCSTSGGQNRWFLAQAAPLSGAMDGVVVCYSEITERKQKEEALLASEEQYRQLASVMPAALYTCDADGIITYYNPRAAELWGRAPQQGDTDEKWCGSFRLFYPDGTPLPHDQTPMAMAVQTGEPTFDTEVMIERPDGSIITVNVNIVPLYDQNGQPGGALNVFQDVSQSKRLASDNQRHKVLLEKIINEAPAIIAFLKGSDHRYILVNPAYELVARGKGVLLGRTVAEVWPEAADVVIPLLDRVFQTGELFQVTDMPISVKRDSGPEISYFTASFIPMHNASGDVEGILIVGSETSERKQAELERERLLEALEQERAQLTELTETLEERVLERTAQVRDLAAALSLAEQRERTRISQILHDDLQQLLYSQLMRLELLRQTLPPEQRAKQGALITGMVEQLDQAVHVTRALSAELNPPQMETSDLAEAMQWLALHMEEIHGLKVALVTSGTTEVKNRETRSILFQVVRELLFNVVKHADTDDARVELYSEAGNLVIHVEDSGVGFDTGSLPTSSNEPGGLGLVSISERLELIGGRLKIDSTSGTGTRITVVTPVTQVVKMNGS